MCSPSNLCQQRFPFLTEYFNGCYWFSFFFCSDDIWPIPPNSSTLLYPVSLLFGCWDRWSTQKYKYQEQRSSSGQLTKQRVTLIYKYYFSHKFLFQMTGIRYCWPPILPPAITKGALNHENINSWSLWALLLVFGPLGFIGGGGKFRRQKIM